MLIIIEIIEENPGPESQRLAESDITCPRDFYHRTRRVPKEFEEAMDESSEEEPFIYGSAGPEFHDFWIRG